MRVLIRRLGTATGPRRASRRQAGREGAVLLEAVVAITVLGIVISGTAWMATEALASFNRAREVEAEMREANRFLTAVSLWSAMELDRRLGTTEQGPWLLRIDRTREHLYVVTLTERRPDAPPLLGTILFRGPEEEGP